jgi:hypothetical protein
LLTNFVQMRSKRPEPAAAERRSSLISAFSVGVDSLWFLMSSTTRRDDEVGERLRRDGRPELRRIMSSNRDQRA